MIWGEKEAKQILKPRANDSGWIITPSATVTPASRSLTFLVESYRVSAIEVFWSVVITIHNVMAYATRSSGQMERVFWAQIKLDHLWQLGRKGGEEAVTNRFRS